MQIISNSFSLHLAKPIADNLQIELNIANVQQFRNGELNVEIPKPINSNVIIVQAGSDRINETLIELLLLIYTAKQAGANKITVITPYLAYSRQDRSHRQHSPISAKMVIKLIEQAGASRVISLDMHSPQIEGFFDIPIDNLTSASLFWPIIEQISEPLIVAPDLGSSKRATTYSDMLSTQPVILHKERSQGASCQTQKVTGPDVKNRHCIIIDDIVDSGATLVAATKLLTTYKAASVSALVTHGILSNGAIKSLSQANLTKLYITDSIKSTSPISTTQLALQQVPCWELLATRLKQLQKQHLI